MQAGRVLPEACRASAPTAAEAHDYRQEKEGGKGYRVGLASQYDDAKLFFQTFKFDRPGPRVAKEPGSVGGLNWQGAVISADDSRAHAATV